MSTFKGITLPDGTTYFPEGSGSAIDTVSVSVDNNTGVPSATGSVSGTTLNLDFKNLKGETGSTGPQGEPGQGVPAGGTAGQVLKKKSGTDYDTEWADETGGGGTGGNASFVKKSFEIVIDEETAFVELDLENPMNILGIVGGGYFPKQTVETSASLYLGDSKNLSQYGAAVNLTTYRKWNADTYVTFSVIGFDYVKNDEYLIKTPISWSAASNISSMSSAAINLSGYTETMFDSVSKIKVQFQNQSLKMLVGTKFNITVYGFEV